LRVGPAVAVENLHGLVERGEKGLVIVVVHGRI
jgi:hypothetical protein